MRFLAKKKGGLPQILWHNRKMAGIYRKSSLDRLASPEQLDKMIQIASPSLWLAVAGAGLVMLTVLIWAIFGRLPDNQEISGIYMSSSNVQGVYSTYGGKVSQVAVSKNDYVEEGDVIAVITNDSAGLSAEQLEERIQAVESVTLTSENDQATSDNTQLLEYKLQYQQAGMTREQKEKQLETLQQQLQEAKAKTAEYKAKMDAAEQAYLAAVGDDGMNTASYNYQKAQSDLSAAQSEYQSLYNTVSSLESSVNSASATLQSYQGQYAELESQYTQLEASISSKSSQLQATQEQYTSLQQAYQGQEIPEDVQQQMSTLQSSIGTLNTEIENATTQMASVSSSISQLEAGISSAQSQVDTYQSQLNDANAQLASAQAAVESAQSALSSAESVYQKYYTSQSSSTANQTALSTAFSEASTMYSNAFSQQQSLEQQIASIDLETDFASEDESANKEALEKQFQAAKESVLNDLQRELDNTLKSGAEEQILASVSGTVVDCAIQQDQMIGQGTEIAKIQAAGTEETSANIIRCYVPIADGKKLEAGMSAVITPSTVSEDEYGHMSGTVISVGTYTVSTAEMQQTLGDDSMVSAMQQQGPCVEVVIDLEKDSSTASGYAWSNRKGETVSLEENTMVSVKVRVKEDAPISKLIPFLKSKLDVEVENQDSAA